MRRERRRRRDWARNVTVPLNHPLYLEVDLADLRDRERNRVPTVDIEKLKYSKNCFRVFDNRVIVDAPTHSASPQTNLP